MSPVVVTEMESSIVQVELNRPDRRNAFEPEMIQLLNNTFQEISKREDVRVVILSGQGESFCAGADLNWMKSMVQFSKTENIQDSNELYQMFSTIYDCPHPVIGKIHGHAMGGGVGLVSVCDLVAIERDTKLAFSEVKLGLVPSVISPFVMKKISMKDSLELFLTGETFTAEKASQIGLAQFVGTKDEVEDYVFGKSDMLKSAGPKAVRDTKKLIRAVSGEMSEKIRQLTVNTISERRVSKEGQEGLLSFFEKRKPKWVQ